MKKLLPLLVFVVCANSGAQVYRCGNAYGSAPCPGGAVVQDNLTVFSDAALQSTMSRCTSYSGAVFWTDGSCSAHAGLTTDQVKVPASLPILREKIKVAEAALAARSKPQSQRGARTGSAMSSTDASDRALCMRLQNKVRQIETAQRKGGSAARMNDLGERKREAQDALFRERCR